MLEMVFGPRCWGDRDVDLVFTEDLKVMKGALQALGHELDTCQEVGKIRYYLKGEGLISDEMSRKIAEQYIIDSNA